LQLNPSESKPTRWFWTQTGAFEGQATAIRTKFLADAVQEVHRGNTPKDAKDDRPYTIILDSNICLANWHYFHNRRFGYPGDDQVTVLKAIEADVKQTNPDFYEKAIKKCTRWVIGGDHNCDAATSGSAKTDFFGRKVTATISQPTTIATNSKIGGAFKREQFQFDYIWSTEPISNVTSDSKETTPIHKLASDHFFVSGEITLPKTVRQDKF